MNNSSLQELIKSLSNRSSAGWQQAWQHFLSRYHRFIYHCITKRCKRWKAERLGLQFNEIIEDVYGQVMMILCQDEARVLREFTDKANEDRFLAWLATLCNHATTRYLKQQFFRRAMEWKPEANGPRPAFLMAEPHDEWMMFQWINQCLREKQQSRRANFERDLFIFYLITFADFSPQQIRFLPCLRDIGDRVVYVAVNRIRSILREYRDSMDI